jgi:nitrate/TMAO reductase-like tetraheme cytochrome c subunit
MAFVVLWAGGLVGTSFEWFCTGPCHKVHDDNTLAYRASSHTNVSCMACHEPLNANPLLFTLMKVHVLPDLPATIFNTYEIPVNAASHVAMEFPDELCTQCHNLATRPATPSEGIIIDHAKHTENDVTCTTCHNRVAHPENDIELVLGDRKHEDWMFMDACFRCHSLEEGGDAPGECSACHTETFRLTPPSHDVPAWYQRYGASGGHAKAALEESESVRAAIEHASGHEPMDPKHAEGPVLEPAAQIHTCFTCHKTTFCGDCHQLPMPHPADFKENHGREGYTKPKACANCHARSASEAKGTDFCNACHHPSSIPGEPWRTNHPKAVVKDGSRSCFECHNPKYCATCHVRGAAAAKAYLQEQYAK